MSEYECTLGIPASNEENTILNVLSDIFMDLTVLSGKWQVIVVANGCNDSTLDQLISFGCTHAKLIKEESSDRERWFTFAKNQHIFQICEITENRKSTALNVIHNNAQGKVVILLDADIRLSKSILFTMLQTLKDNPPYAVVAPKYQGTIAPFSINSGLSDYLRVLVSHAINQFDSYIPRLDGKAFAYRKALIEKHIHIIPVDTWLEGIAWTESQGCIYLQHYTVTYKFPTTFRELSYQYARYLKSLQVFMADYPSMHEALSQGRQAAQALWKGKVRLLDRFIGWTFFRWISIFSKLFNIHINMQEATWDPTQTTKN